MEKSRCLLCFTCVIKVLRLTCVSGPIVKPGGIWTIIYLIYRKVFITTPPNFQPGPIYFYLKIVIYRNQMFEMKRDTKILEILIASYDHSTKARPTLSLLW